MIRITNLEATNLNGAIRGMRNPFKTTDKSDSHFEVVPSEYCSEVIIDWASNFNILEYIKTREEELEQEDKIIDYYYDKGIIGIGEDIYHLQLLGPKDLELAQRLIKAGSPHDKFMRQIFISMDIEAPLYWWKEMDTYKVATTSNSESTMHTIMKKEFTPDMFSFDNSFYNSNELRIDSGNRQFALTVLMQQIFILNTLRNYWLKEEDDEKKKQIWRTVIQMLPSSYMQKRTWTGDYSIARAIANQREGHKMLEWHDFTQVLQSLPWSEELIFYRGEK